MTHHKRRPSLESLDSRTLLSVYFDSFGTNEFPIAIIDGPGQKLWFTAQQVGGFRMIANIVGSLDPTTGAIQAASTSLTAESDLPTNVGGMAVGSDGNVWFTDSGLAEIGFINPTTMAVTEIAIPTAASGPAAGMAADAAGNIWFTEPGRSKLGEVNPATHVITEYPLPNLNSEPQGITLGPLGNLWFTEIKTSKVASINPTTKVVTEYATPTAGAAPQGITLAPDGNLWFSENLQFFGGNTPDRIAEINPTTGVSSDFPANADSGVTTGPDGQVWFTGTNGASIGEINISTHAVSEYTGINFPHALVTGPDGNLWVNAQYLTRATIIPAGQSVIRGSASSDPAANGTLAGSQIAGATVYLDLKGDGRLDPGDPTAVTVANGDLIQYTFTGLAPGTYTVRALASPGDVVTSPSGGAISVTTTSGEVAQPAPFGIVQTSATLPFAVDPTPFGAKNPDVQTAEVTGFYNLILGRAPDPAGLASFVNLLKTSQATLQQVTTDFLDSTEYVSRVVASYYLTYLGRSGSSGEVAGWVVAIQAGTTEERVAAYFLDSPEFSAKYADNSSFVQALYGDILGRAVSAPKVAGWTMLLGTGTGRAQVVAYILGSTEADLRAVSGDYTVFLVRMEDNEGANFYIHGLQNGASLTSVALAFADSPEYAQRANANVA